MKKLGTFEVQLDMPSLGRILAMWYPLTYILALDGEHEETVEIVPGIAVEVEPSWHWHNRMTKARMDGFLAQEEL